MLAVMEENEKQDTVTDWGDELCSQPRYDSAMNAYKKRKEQEMHETVLSYIDMLYHVALGLTHDSNKAHQLTSDSVAQALQTPCELRGCRPIKSWLLTILRNTFLNQYQSKEPKRPWVGVCPGSV